MKHSLCLKLCFLSLSAWKALAIPIPSHPEESGPYFQGDLKYSADYFSGRVEPKYRWTNKTIHYEFAREYPENLQATFALATEHISNRTCLQFKRRDTSNNPSKDYVLVMASRSCYSYVGRQGGKQVISLPPVCNNLGTFVHELLHAIGFHHEQSRTDRDDHVKIIFDNIQQGKESQFRKYDKASVTSFGVPYDYDSILHYSEKAFSKDPSRLNTIEPLVPGTKIGQRRGMSEKDVTKVNRMYDCA